jgi:F0F1-type ATP synthase assembly protein I
MAVNGTNKRIVGDDDNENEKFEEDLAARFPDLEEDARLKAGSTSLPDIPDVRFERPATKTANPPKPGEGRAGSFVSDRSLRGMGQASTIGITLVASIAIGTGFGYLLDRYVIKSATPWGLIIGFLLGVVSGFINLVRVANSLNQDK